MKSIPMVDLNPTYSQSSHFRTVLQCRQTRGRGDARACDFSQANNILGGMVFQMP